MSVEKGKGIQEAQNCGSVQSSKRPNHVEAVISAERHAVRAIGAMCFLAYNGFDPRRRHHRLVNRNFQPA